MLLEEPDVSNNLLLGLLLVFSLLEGVTVHVAYVFILFSWRVTYMSQYPKYNINILNISISISK